MVEWHFLMIFVPCVVCGLLHGEIKANGVLKTLHVKLHVPCSRHRVYLWLNDIHSTN